jgi:hypothetical protein
MVIQQTRNAESEVLHTKLPKQPLTVLQNTETSQYHDNRVSFQPVYRIQGFIFIHYQQLLGVVL